MRPFLATTALALLALSLPAVAQQGAGWVDPPAKAAETPKTKPAEPAPAPQPEAAAPARRETRSATVDEPQAAQRSARGTRRAGEERQARRQAAREAAARESGARATRSARVAPPVFTAPREAPAMARSEPDPRFSEWAGTAQRLSEAYLDSVSSPGDGMATAAPRFYGSQVRFHGRMMSLSALMAEKRRFARRWPERRYEPEGEPRVSCNAATQSCLVRTVHAFSAGSPGRGARSQGVAELMLTVSFANGRPIIVEETSRVLRRGGLSASIGGRGGA
ncbi:hypothetical protein ASG52_21100 [Methylobacterium sp. Leaf456]|uniref:hypothetical protein n=1 Tax=Methylobacterium sp. Leaf456 TaxID=1736382 RepID=UPI00070133B0|nr:hypothetical protein [Methylobacterium sp. Leaf456]KQT58634.1 hypothetical protein ASG52_21100 [Methylobacterium sp. Leaf456]